MAFPLHIRQAARGARAMKALRTGGSSAFEAAIREPLEDVPAIYREVPIHFFGNRFTVVGPGVAVDRPRHSKVMDYELEVGVVTKRTDSNISAKKASEHTTIFARPNSVPVTAPCGDVPDHDGARRSVRTQEDDGHDDRLLSTSRRAIPGRHYIMRCRNVFLNRHEERSLRAYRIALAMKGRKSRS
jgi:hypothetical protein